MLKIIFGSVNAENKFIKIDDKITDKAYCNKNAISYLPQDNFIPSALSVKKAIGLFINNAKSKEFCEDDFIQNLLGNRISELSGGELKYLQVKLLLFADSNFILLDEPFSKIAPIIIEKIKIEIIKHSKGKGISHIGTCLKRRPASIKSNFNI